MSLFLPNLTGWKRNLKGDIFGGISSAVVALPLALAFGVLSGAGATAGLYGAIFAGIIASIFGGSPAQITGPTGEMTVLLVLIYKDFGVSGLFMAMFMSSLIQLALSLVRVGRYVHFIPYSVIAGFTNGIAILIFSQQLAALRTPDGGLGLIAVGLAAAVIAIMFFWPRISRVVPGSLIALLTTTVVAVFLFQGEVKMIGEIPAGLPKPSLAFLLEQWPNALKLLRPAIMVALLGAIDSLLAAMVVDELAGTRHNSDKEIFGQGLGNLVATIFGGIVGTGAIVRAAVNVRAGGRTPLSGVTHGLLILLVTVSLGKYAAVVPHATLAGILMMTALGMVDWQSIRDLRRAPFADSAAMLVTAGLTVFSDLVTAVAVGMVLSMVAFTTKMSQAPVATRYEGNGFLVTLNGPFFFGISKRFLEVVESASAEVVQVWDLSGVTSVDATGAFVLKKAVRTVRERGGQVYVVGLQPPVQQVLESLEATADLSPDCFCYTLPDALALVGA